MADFDFGKMAEATKKYKKETKILALLPAIEEIFTRGEYIVELLRASGQSIVIAEGDSYKLILTDIDLVCSLDGQNLTSVRNVPEGNAREVAARLKLYGVEPSTLISRFEEGVQKIIDDAP